MSEILNTLTAQQWQLVIIYSCCTGFCLGVLAYAFHRPKPTATEKRESLTFSRTLEQQRKDYE